VGDKTRLITLFTALIAASFGVHSAAKRSATERTGSAAAPHAYSEASLSRSNPAAAGLTTTLNDFDKSTTFKSPLNEDGSCSGETQKDLFPMKWAIATVPDPVRSNLKLDFDREIEAVQNAASSSGYQFERFWFPWHLSALTETDAEGPGGGERRESDTVPGVLLFHRSDLNSGPAAGLAIFLVGETPTSGINPGQFRSAVCLGDSLGTDRTSLTVIGPAYSASFDSLARLAQHRRLKVRSWTTDYESQRVFVEQTHADFLTTRTASIVSVNSFVHFLRSEWGESGPVVILKEEGTALGAGLKRVSNDNAPVLNDSGVRLIEFPRNLSKLRNASETEAVTTVSSGTDTQIPHPGLTLSLKDDSSSFEIPTFAQSQTPVSQESVLFSVANLLKTGTVHYAAVIASDPLDVLYLSRYLRAACSNLRIFLLDPDLLMEHGLDSSDYAGILSVTTYPLFTMSQLWEASSDALNVFPSENSEAAYNAVVSALWTPGSPTPHYVDIRNPLVSQQNGKSPVPLWLTVAGRNGFEPIAILPPGNEPLTMNQIPGPVRLSPEYWDSWGYTFAILLAACLLFAFCVGGASAAGARTASLFAVKPREQGAPFRALYITIIGACLCILALAWIAIPSEVVLVNLAGAPHQLLSQRFPFCVFCAGALAAASALAATAHRRQRVADKTRHRRIRGLMFPRTPAPLTGFSCSTAVLAVSLIFVLPEPFKSPNTSVLQQLWHILSLGSFCLGVTVAAAISPVWDLLHSHVPLSQTGPFRASRAQRLNIWAPAFGAVALAAMSATAAVTLLVLFGVRDPNSAASHFFLACRSLNLTSSVSPLVPFSLLLIVVLTLAFVHLKRIVYYEDHCPTVPYLRKGPYCPRLRFTIAETRHRTGRIAFHPAYALAGAALMIVVYRVWTSHTHTTLETPPIEQAMIYTAVAAGFLLLLVWIRVLLLWSSFSEFLQQLERHPLRHVFSLLPRGFVWSPVWQGGGKKRTHVAITRSLECILALRNHPGAPAKLKAAIDGRLQNIKLQVKELLNISATRRRIPRRLFRELERNLAAVAGAAADYLEARKWGIGDYELKGELAAREGTKDALKVPQYKYEEDEPATICGELVAFRFLTFINYVLWQLDNMVGFLSFGFLLLVIALNAYDFRSRSIIDWLLVLMFAVLTSGILTVLAQAARDAILSRITGTKEGKLDRNFVTHAVSYGALPLLVLAATHFPSIGKFFFSWVKPALEAIH
jgi:hypothetical protein